MQRVRTRFVRTSAAAVVAVLLTAPVAASAQAGAPEPVITWSSRTVAFGGNGAITGWLEGGSSGQRVNLQRWRPSTGWRRIDSRLTDENLRVRFSLVDLRRSANYRLQFADPESSYTARSSAVRVAVGVRLRMNLSKSHLIKGRRVRVYGTLYPKVPGRTVVLQHKVDGSWRWVARLAAGDGSFSTYFRPRKQGFRRLRVRFSGDEHNRRGAARRAMRVYVPALATWYGPGLYGNRTACGQRLGYDTLGVAHRTLPCGTKVNILYEGRTISVPVIDRGPYSSADWDLTAETAERLRFSGKDRIGTQK